jgi:hypothetical protein
MVVRRGGGVPGPGEGGNMVELLIAVVVGFPRMGGPELETLRARRDGRILGLCAGDRVAIEGDRGP